MHDLLKAYGLLPLAVIALGAMHSRNRWVRIAGEWSAVVLIAAAAGFMVLARSWFVLAGAVISSILVNLPWGKWRLEYDAWRIQRELDRGKR